MSDSVLLMNFNRENKVVRLTSHSDSPPTTQTIPSYRQPHSQPKTSRKQGVVLTEQGWQKLLQAGVLCDDFDRRYTYEELSERSLLDSRTVSRILSREVKVDKRTLKAFFSAFNLSLVKDDYAIPKANMVRKTAIDLDRYPNLSAATTKASLSVEELAQLLPGIVRDLITLLEILNVKQLDPY